MSLNTTVRVDISRRRRVAVYTAIAVGSALLTSAVLIPTYAAPRIVKIPASVDSTTIATGTAKVLIDIDAAIAQGYPIIDRNVPITVLQHVTSEEPTNTEIVTLQSARMIHRDDRTGDARIVSATIERSSVDRTTSMPVAEPVGTIQRDATKPPDDVVHDGLQVKFPFGVEQKSYPYFDADVRKSSNINFVEETTVDGVLLYRFNQDIPPTDTGGKLTLPAAAWGIPGDGQVLMHRFYTARRDVWVEPVTGAIVDAQQHVEQVYARTIDDPNAVTILDMNVRLDNRTTDTLLDQARTYKRLIEFGTRYVPVGAAILGIILVATGAVVGYRVSKRTNAV
jgi:hypothetical protein